MFNTICTLQHSNVRFIGIFVSLSDMPKFLSPVGLIPNRYDWPLFCQMALIFGRSVSKAQYLFQILGLGLLIIPTALHYCPRYLFALLTQWSNWMHYFCQRLCYTVSSDRSFVYKFQNGLSATCPCSPGLTCAVTGIDHGKKKRIFQCIGVGTYQETEGLEEELPEKVATAKPWASLSSLSFFGLLL